MKHMQKGMTIVGVIVAGAILSTSMIVLVDYQNALSRLRFQQQHVAVGNLLASEGVELARGVRDVNFAPNNRSNPSTRWDSGLDVGSYAPDYSLTLSSGFTTQTNCSEGFLDDSCQLKRNAATSFYTRDLSGVDEELEVFRFIEVSEILGHSDRKKIVSTVVLRGRAGNESRYRAATILYNTDL